MPLLRRIIAVFALSLLASASAAAAAEVRDTAVFDFYVRSFRAGILVFNGVQSGNYYAVNGRFATAGLLSLVKSMRYDATVTGSIVDGVPRPDTYTLTVNAGHDQHTETMSYTNGKPQGLVRSPARAPDPGALDPASQGGTVDTLTAIYETMREMPEAEACTATIAMYDGTRHASLRLWPADGGGGTLACNGEYRRVAGYSAKDMEHPAFPFRMTYAATADGMVQVDRVDMDSIYGTASLKRR
ncbi:MAG: DUF3108 domain-containing protein [Rhodobacteraceae bacterium]|nr:DUF3108 domain-containing protein [Paracoccaceae bacterium]